MKFFAAMTAATGLIHRYQSMIGQHMRRLFCTFIVIGLLAGCGIRGYKAQETSIQGGSVIGGAKAQYDQAMLSIEGDEGEYPSKVLRGIELLKRSAEQGYAPAQFKLGYYYHAGSLAHDCLKQEPENAYYWYEKAAEQNYPEAQYELAMLYNPETGFKKFVDRSKCVYWMKRAADSGQPKAQHWLGRMSVGR